MIHRPGYLDRIQAYLDKPIVKVITGVRRVGKSTLLSPTTTPSWCSPWTRSAPISAIAFDGATWWISCSKTGDKGTHGRPITFGPGGLEMAI